MTCKNSNRKRRKKSRGNGTGTAFKRGSTWTAQVVVGWKEIDPEKPVRAITRSKGGFKTRDAALQHCPILKAGGVQKQQETPVLEHYWETYKNGAYKALSYTKKANYKTAWNRLASIHNIRIDQLTVADLQNLIDKKCPTHYTAGEGGLFLRHFAEVLKMLSLSLFFNRLSVSRSGRNRIGENHVFPLYS